jgi:hypothetical protein
VRGARGAVLIWLVVPRGSRRGPRSRTGRGEGRWGHRGRRPYGNRSARRASSTRVPPRDRASPRRAGTRHAGTRPSRRRAPPDGGPGRASCRWEGSSSPARPRRSPPPGAGPAPVSVLTVPAPSRAERKACQASEAHFTRIGNLPTPLSARSGPSPLITAGSVSTPVSTRCIVSNNATASARVFPFTASVMREAEALEIAHPTPWKDPDRQLVAAVRVLPIRRTARRRHRMEVPRAPVVIEDHFLIERVEGGGVGHTGTLRAHSNEAWVKRSKTARSSARRSGSFSIVSSTSAAKA